METNPPLTTKENPVAPNKKTVEVEGTVKTRMSRVDRLRQELAAAEQKKAESVQRKIDTVQAKIDKLHEQREAIDEKLAAALAELDQVRAEAPAISDGVGQFNSADMDEDEEIADETDSEE